MSTAMLNAITIRSLLPRLRGMVFTFFSAAWTHRVTIATICTVFALWALLTETVLSRQVLPSPQAVFSAALRLRLNLLEHAGVTFLRVVVGWGLGAHLGIVVGLLMTRSATVRAVLHPLIELVRPIPPIALTPFFIIWFGLGFLGQILLIALGCFMVLAIDTYVAAENLPTIYIRAAATLGANKAQLYRTVVFPAILPALLSGFRVAAALAFALGIAAELLGAQRGIGFMMMVARRTLDTDAILLGIVVIGTESYLFDSLLRFIISRLCPWTESTRTAISLVRTKHEEEK